MYEDAINNPNIVLTPLTDSFMMYGVNFNTNETIKTYPSIDSPTFNAIFREAISCAIDKDWIVENIFQYMADKIDVPIPASQSNWWNTSVTYPNYPYQYSLTRAAQLLDSAGFVMGSDNTRDYPFNWTPSYKAGKPLDRIVFRVDSTDNIREAIAEHIVSQMNAIGIPVNLIEEAPGDVYNDVLIDRNYHMFMGDQAVNNLPVYLAILANYVFMQASFGQQWTYANLWQWWERSWPYPGMKDILAQTGLSDLFSELWGSQNPADALRYCKLIQGLYTENALEVPICSVKSYFAYRRDIIGIANEEGYGLDNPYTYFNAYKVNDPSSPIVVGIVKDPVNLNILYSIEYCDYQILDKIYAGLISQNPYDQSIDQRALIRRNNS
jgi:ABC-type transport system substrate-binding protein